MKRILQVLCVGALAVASAACVTYTGVTKDAKGQVYLTGQTSFLIFGSSWVKRCDEKGAELVCQELSVTGIIPPHEIGWHTDGPDRVVAPERPAQPATPIPPSVTTEALTRAPQGTTNTVPEVHWVQIPEVETPTPPPVDPRVCREFTEKICACQSKLSDVVHRDL